jgi:murein DD-endopeptidase MepM/ murein hydrolase activator NlpD
MFARVLLLIALVLVPAAAALGDTGGVSAPSSGSVAPDEAGGIAYGTHLDRPAALLRISGAPKLRVSVRITEQRASVVIARVEVLRLPGSRRVAQARLGRVRVGRTVTVRFPRALRPGHYIVRVHAHDGAGHQLRNVPKVPLLVHGTHHTSVTVTDGGVFPVAGPHTYGDRFGAPRKGYSHQGQDILAPRGTPIVAPVAATVYTTGYQRSAAGEYVVLAAPDGHAYFFAHCIRHSTLVAAGQTVAAGTQLCSLGATGDATGPHLHFEEWVGGWRVDAASTPIDPLPQLRAWDRG